MVSQRKRLLIEAAFGWGKTVDWGKTVGPIATANVRGLFGRILTRDLGIVEPSFALDQFL